MWAVKDFDYGLIDPLGEEVDLQSEENAVRAGYSVWDTEEDALSWIRMLLMEENAKLKDKLLSTFSLLISLLT